MLSTNAHTRLAFVQCTAAALAGGMNTAAATVQWQAVQRGGRAGGQGAEGGGHGVEGIERGTERGQTDVLQDVQCCNGLLLLVTVVLLTKWAPKV